MVRGVEAGDIFRKGRIEGSLVLEVLDVSPKSLMEDNQSQEARELSTKWEDNKNHHNITVVVACVDARGFSPSPESTESVRSIDVGGKKSIEIFKSESVGLIVVKGHFDGEASVPGKKTVGCGGAAAKEEVLNKKHEEVDEGTEEYAKNKISHADTLVQTFSTAYELAKATGKPTLVLMQNHRTGKIHPVAAFNDNGTDKISSKLDPKDLFENYDEAKIYADGVPTLPDNIFENEKIRAFIVASRKQMSEMLLTYPDLSEIQKAQNPSIIFVSSKLPSIRTRYPKTTEGPNSVLKLHLPREKNGEKAKLIDPEVKTEVYNQIHYPVQHSLKHFDKPGESFSRTNRIVIETSDIAVSKDFAADLIKKPWMKKWLALPDHRIIVLQNKEGITSVAEWFGLEPQS